MRDRSPSVERSTWRRLLRVMQSTVRRRRVGHIALLAMPPLYGYGSFRRPGYYTKNVQVPDKRCDHYRRALNAISGRARFADRTASTRPDRPRHAAKSRCPEHVLGFPPGACPHAPGGSTVVIRASPRRPRLSSSRPRLTYSHGAIVAGYGDVPAGEHVAFALALILDEIARHFRDLDEDLSRPHLRRLPRDARPGVTPELLRLPRSLRRRDTCRPPACTTSPATIICVQPCQ